MKEVDGVMYVPSNVFNEFDGISVVQNITAPDNFVISNSNNGKYVSFNTRKISPRMNKGMSMKLSHGYCMVLSYQYR